MFNESAFLNHLQGLLHWWMSIILFVFDIFNTQFSLDNLYNLTKKLRKKWRKKWKRMMIKKKEKWERKEKKRKRKLGFSSCTAKTSFTPNAFIKIPKVTMLTSSSFFFFIHHSLYSSYKIHFHESWPSSSFVVVSGLIEVHCYDGSLAVRCCRGGWCCGVTANIFFSCNFDLFGINKHMDW